VLIVDGAAPGRRHGLCAALGLTAQKLASFALTSPASESGSAQPTHFVLSQPRRDAFIGELPYLNMRRDERVPRTVLCWPTASGQRAWRARKQTPDRLGEAKTPCLSSRHEWAGPPKHPHKSGRRPSNAFDLSSNKRSAPRRRAIQGAAPDGERCRKRRRLALSGDSARGQSAGKRERGEIRRGGWRRPHRSARGRGGG